MKNRYKIRAGMLAAALLLLLTAIPFPPRAAAEAGVAPGVVAGGLTELPSVNLGPNLAQNNGFETVSGSLPANWTAGSGWSIDSADKHSGSRSYRWTSGAPTSSQPVQLKAGAYNFSAWVKTDLSTGNPGMRLQLDLRPTINQWFTTDVINGATGWTLYEIKNIVVPQDVTATLKLENYNAPSGTAWFDDVILQKQLPDPVKAFMLYPNYRGMLFDDQSQTMKFDLSVTPPAGGPASALTVTGRLKEESTGTVVSTATWPGADNFTAEIDGSPMAAGKTYLVEFSVNSSPAYTYPAYRVSKVPAAARQTMNISFDDKNRLLIRDTPRFLLGVYDSGGGFGNTEPFWEDQLWSPTGSRRLDGLDINFYLNYWMGEAPADSMNALMNNLQAHDVMYLQTGNCFSGFPAGGNFLINSSDAYVSDIGSNPGSAGYYTADECLPGMVDGVFNQYDRLRSLDPDSMTLATLFGNPDLTLWRDSADVIATDPYPLYASEPTGGYPHNQVAEWTRAAQNAVKNSRPVMTVLQDFKFTSQGRFPTRAEMRDHAYMAIVEGAKGLWWWSVGNGDGAMSTTATCPTAGSWCTYQQDRMSDLKAVVNELAALEPALVADDAPAALQGNSNPTAIKTKVKIAGGKGYVFAYNNTNAQVTDTLTWRTAPGTVTVNAESRTLVPSGSSFTDTFGPYEAHVYIIPNGGGTGDATVPAVAMTAPADQSPVSGTIGVSANASDNVGVSGVQFKLDGANLGAEDTTSPYSVNWDTTTASAGSHTLTAVARDAAGNAATSTAVHVTVNNAGGRTYIAPKALSAPTIDGNLGEYIDAPAITLTKANGTGKYRMLYDDDALYVAAEVDDQKLETLGYAEDGSIFQEDSLEFMLDTLFDRGAARGADDYKFFANTVNAHRDEQGLNVAWDGVWSSAVQATGTLNNGTDTDTGYNIEVRIPWSTMGVANGPAQGKSMGFNLVMNDRDAGVWMWSPWATPNSEINVPDNWGTLVLGAPLASPWMDQDIGAVGLSGSFAQSGGTYTVNASGANIWGTADAFHYVYKPLTGDGTIVARVTGLEATNFSAKAGVMIREGLAPGSRQVMTTLESGGSVTFLRRTSTDGTTAFTAGGSASAPVWVKLVRSGNAFEGYRSSDGVNWTLVGSATVAMGSQVYAGLAVTGHNDTTLNTSTFDNVSIQP